MTCGLCNRCAPHGRGDVGLASASRPGWHRTPGEGRKGRSLKLMKSMPGHLPQIHAH
jgi:hypothetical protein